MVFQIQQYKDFVKEIERNRSPQNSTMFSFCNLTKKVWTFTVLIANITDTSSSWIKASSTMQYFGDNLVLTSSQSQQNETLLKSQRSYSLESVNSGFSAPLQSFCATFIESDSDKAFYMGCICNKRLPQTD